MLFSWGPLKKTRLAETLSHGNVSSVISVNRCSDRSVIPVLLACVLSQIETASVKRSQFFIKGLRWSWSLKRSASVTSVLIISHEFALTKCFISFSYLDVYGSPGCLTHRIQHLQTKLLRHSTARLSEMACGRWSSLHRSFEASLIMKMSFCASRGYVKVYFHATRTPREILSSSEERLGAYEVKLCVCIYYSQLGKWLK